MPAEWGLADKIIRTTVRIETMAGGAVTGHGTGFFFDFSRTVGSQIPAIVTNKHVIANCDSVKLVFNMTHDGMPKTDIVEIGDLNKLAVPHPEGDIDLVAIPIAGLDAGFKHLGDMYAHAFAGIGDILDKDDEPSYKGIETITTVGYPLDIYDSVNNMPISRQGITATSIGMDYMGRPDFLLDVACFPGASGSPVYVYTDGIRVEKNGDINLGLQSAVLVGVIKEAVNAVTPVVMGDKRTSLASSGSMNIAVAIKSRKLIEIADILNERAKLEASGEARSHELHDARRMENMK